MPDYGQKATDAEYRRLKAKINDIYKQAYKEVQQKGLDFAQAHAKREAKLRQAVADGKMTQADFDAWMRGQVFQGEQWAKKQQQMADTLYHADQVAQDIINDSRYSVFAENANYIGYSLEHDAGISTNFGLYDANSVRRLVKEEPDLLPPKKMVGRDKSYQWYNRMIQTAITQGIIQGEGIGKIANRIGKQTGERNCTAMLRNARTMFTGAQNAGRIEGLHQAQRLGIKVRKQWMATLDSRTRDAHADLDGQIQEVDDPFESELGDIMFPGDPTADPGNVYNCRCTLVYIYPEYPSEMQRRTGDGEIVGNMTYREWEEMKRGEGKNNSNAAQSDNNGFNIMYTEKPQYTDGEASALHDYTTSSYSGINSLLREGGLENYPDAKKIVNKIDSAMEKSELVSPITVSRGERMNGLQTLFPDMKRRWLEDPEKLRQLEGRTAPCPQFISTTAGEKVSEAFSGRGLVWHYEVEDGVNAIDMSRFASTAIRDVEREVLIDRDVEVIIDRLEIKTDSDGDIVGDVIAYARIRGKHGNR